MNAHHVLVGLLLFLTISCTAPEGNTETDATPEPEWVSLFNGKDLSGWIPKIRNYELYENFENTFRVEEGAISVGYEGYGPFDYRYGHIFYENPFDYYHFRMQYRFIGEQAEEGEGWAYRNSGIMLHCQPPETMLKDQDFPISIEVQLLGGAEEGERTTANLCTPGTHVHMADTLLTDHCFPSSSQTYRGEEWVNVYVEVYGDSLIRHIVEGDTVLSYTLPQIGGGVVNGFDPNMKPDGTVLRSGYISLQSESHPVQFRNIEIMDLSDQFARR
ncbi:MAG: DUF1080 domain-containing protein [Bacteroidota bacterium]